jgi:pimeloyl-ACP methyl ester carboxylesterase
MPRSGRRLVVIVIALVALLPVAGFGYQTIASWLDHQAYPPPGQMVDVGGYKLHLYCTGEGSPIVVMDSGLGGAWLDWSKVQPVLSATTRICTYDRAGMGWSDVGEEPRDAQQAVRELHRLLENAGIDGALLLVGHSNGGLRVQLYAAHYPEQVVGLVLVDPTLTLTPEEQMAALPSEAQARLSALLAEVENTGESAPPDQDNGLQTLAALAPFGVLRLIGGNLLELSAKLPADAREPYRAITMRTTYLPTLLSERRQIERSIQQVRDQNIQFGSLPLVVLINALESSQDVDAMPAAEQELVRLMAPIAYHAGRALADLSAQGQLIVVEGSSHYIQLDRPEIVIQAIEQMVGQVRSGR